MRIQLALECPAWLLNYVQPLADYDFILAHLVLKDKEYAEFYQQSERFKILDNSVNELGRPCTIRELEEAAGVVKPDLIVPPDAIQDYEGTLLGLQKALEIFDFDKLLPVAQGSDAAEFLGYARKLIEEFGFGRIAVPYISVSQRSDDLETLALNRVALVESLIEMGFDDIHLLGMTSLDEFSNYFPYDREVHFWLDTGRPIMCGVNNIVFGKEELPQKVEPSMSKMKLGDLSKIFYNVAYRRKMLA